MTFFNDLISAQELQTLISKAHATSNNQPPSLLIFDVSYDLNDENWGRSQYQQLHIAHAHFADLGLDLSESNPQLAINGGRHPLPSRENFAKWLGRFQIHAQTQVVVYDRNQNNFCGRLWWMLKWCGHARVAVLDGAFKTWLQINGQTHANTPDPILDQSHGLQATYPLSTPCLQLKTIDEVSKNLGSPHQTLLDARGRPRYLGLQEPLDPIAGHIPDALNRPFTENFNEQGLFKSKSQLREEFLTLLNGKAPSTVVHQCGSGVSAVPNIIAMQLAGLGESSLYAGSWSEWSRTPGMTISSPQP